MEIRGLNPDMERLGGGYLFSEVARKVARYRREHPSVRTLPLGIGDVTLPLPHTVVNELYAASRELGEADGFVGYGDVRGMAELRRAICERYARRGVELCEREIFINDGAKGDLGGICELFDVGVSVVPDPSYPVYCDASIIAHRRVITADATEENGYLPTPHDIEKIPALIYLCSPSNPTGAAFTHKALAEWVEHARASGSVIVFDAAYEAYISDPALPHSIFEIEGARECAIEICSFSKSAGFTGLRCGWCVIPTSSPLNKLWERRLACRFNGASCLSQRAALAALSSEGERECSKNIAYYLENADILARTLDRLGVSFCGGKHAPYLWVKLDGSPFCGNNKCGIKSSWDAFSFLLERTGIVSTPGVGFGKRGEGYLRLSSFAPREDIVESARRLEGLGV